MKLLVMQSFPLSCYLARLGLRCPPQHPILENPQPKFLPQCEDQVSHPYKTSGKITVLRYKIRSGVSKAYRFCKMCNDDVRQFLQHSEFLRVCHSILLCR